MSGMGPSILVVADNWSERALIAATLAEAGFSPVAAPDDDTARSAICRGRFAAAVLAVAAEEAVELLRDLRGADPNPPCLVILDPGEMRLVGEDDTTTVVKRPFDSRQLLGCLFELVLREPDTSGAARHAHVAEMGIAAAQLSCLYNRRTIAAAAGANRLAQDLTNQIGHMQTRYRGLAAVLGAA